MNKRFLFTYSVVQRFHTDDDERAARLVRDRIGAIDFNDWVKLEHVETAFSGTLPVNGDSLRSRRDYAQKVVSDLIKPTFNGIENLDRPDVHVALFVDTLEGVIEFTVRGQ